MPSPVDVVTHRLQKLQQKYSENSWISHNHSTCTAQEAKDGCGEENADKSSRCGQGGTILTRQRPIQCTVPHRSVADYEEFVTMELAKAVKKGVVKECPFEGRPKVVNGLKVVTDKPKPRLCIAPMYINMFMAYDSVKYERVQDLMDPVQEGDFMTTSDDKSGYWQLPLRPDMWTYVGLEHKGKFYVCSVMPVGTMSAPHDYTQIKQEIHRPLRDMGVRMTMLLDDRAAVESSKPRAKLQLQGLKSILVALSTTLNWPDDEGKKFQWLPKRQVRFLGFGVDSVRQ